MSSLSNNEPVVEIHERCPDCEVCGNELVAGEGVLFLSKRLCKACCLTLKGEYLHGKRKAGRATGLVRRGGS